MTASLALLLAAFTLLPGCGSSDSSDTKTNTHSCTFVSNAIPNHGFNDATAQRYTPRNRRSHV